MSDYEQLEQVIATLEAQRALLGDAVVEAALAPIREKLAALQSAPTATQRKQVTVLFADLHGYTALSETMDAEEVSEMMNALWARLDAVIVAHEGRIDKHLGDGVMVLYGAPTAREDDPERAIRTALALQEAVQRFGQERTGHPTLPPLRMRVGIHTGPVILGAVGMTGEYTAIGDAVNLANRMEQAAPPGGILISHDCYRHVRGLFNVQPLDPITVKGKSEAIQCYLVRSAKPRAFHLGTRGLEGIETRMIGRDAELRHLQEAFLAASREGRSRLVTVVGEAGVGKSRLLYEFANWLELLPDSLRLFKGRATPQMTNLPYALIRDLFAFRFQILESDSAAAVREKMERGISTFLQPQGEMKGHFIGHLLGFDFAGSPHLHTALDDAQIIPERALSYLVEFFRAVASSQPLVLFLEDIHWADDRSLDAIAQLVRDAPNLRLLVVCLTRRALFEHRPDWGRGDHFLASRIDLRPLTPRESRVLAEDLLRQVEAVPPQLYELIVGNAEGNPFYVEELIKMLLDDGVIVKGEQQWRVEAGRLTTVRVPPTLTGILQARLDSLPPGERAALQQASVVGRIFWDSVVARLYRDDATPRPAPSEAGVALVHEALGTLSARELIYRRDTSAFEGTHEYIFKHALLRDVTYESVLKRLRRVYHAQVAAWLEAASQSRARANEYAALIAEHYEQAGETAKAAEFLGRAGEQALQVSAYREAERFLEQALAFARDHEMVPLQIRLTRQLGEVHWRLGDYPAARHCLEESLALAQGEGDAQGIAEALIHLGNVALLIGEYPEAIRRLEEGVHRAEVLGDRRGVATARTYLGKVAWRVGDYAAARSHYEASLALAQQIGDRGSVATTLMSLGHLIFSLGDYQTARSYYQESLGLYTALENRVGIGTAYNSLGEVARLLREYPEAKRCYLESVTISRELGNRYGVAVALSNLGETSARLGEYAEAEAHYRESLALCEASGNRYGIAYCLGNLGDLLRARGEMAEARHHLRTGLQTALDIGATPLILRILTAIGHLWLAEGRPREAARLLATVRHHPACEDETRGQVIALLDTLPAEHAEPHPSLDAAALAWQQLAGLDGMEARPVPGEPG